MKSDKELYDLFKRNQYGHNERPSPSAWRRLERKLDAHQERQRVVFRRMLSMAAALVFLIFIVGLLSVYTKDKNDQYSYHTQYLQQNISSEKEEIDATKRINLSYQYQKRVKKEIKEGNPEKRLIANTEFLGD